MRVDLVDTLADDWKLWLEWHRIIAPDNADEIRAIEADAGRYLGYVRIVGQRQGDVKLEDYCWPDNLRTLVPAEYAKTPLLGENAEDFETR